MLKDKIDLYAKRKIDLDKDQKEVQKLGAEIKRELQILNLDEFESDYWQASITEISKDELDTEQLLPVLKKIFPNEEDLFIKIEKINLDKLEDMCYNRIIPADLVNQFIIHKEPTIRLNIRKRKEKENGEDNNNPGES